MKTLSVALPLILFCGNLVAQEPLRCVHEPSFLVMTGGNDPVKVNQPIGICYSDDFFSFSSPYCGTHTFRIDQRTVRNDQQGYVVEDFMNEADDDHVRMEYQVNISYGPQKIIVISLTKIGKAYIIKSKAFVGSMQSGSNGLMKKNTASIRRHAEDTSSNINFSLNPLLKLAHARTNVDIMEYVNSRIEWTDKQKAIGDIGSVSLYFTIDTSGKVYAASIQGSIMNAGAIDDVGMLCKKVLAIFQTVPGWVPYMDDEGRKKKISALIKIHLHAR
jgi:hypothetical protein